MTTGDKQKIENFRVMLVQCLMFYFLMIIISMSFRLNKTELDYLTTLGLLIISYKEIGIFFNEINMKVYNFMAEVKLLLK